MVENYTFCDLTYPEKDKLIGIAGIARRCGFHEDYLAGLWRSFLPWQLLWSVKYQNDSSRNPRLGVPSWSWASVDGPVQLPTPNDRETVLVKILKAETFLIGPNAYGQVQGGMIQLCGSLAKLPKLSASENVRSQVDDYLIVVASQILLIDDLGKDTGYSSLSSIVPRSTKSESRPKGIDSNGLGGVSGRSA